MSKVLTIFIFFIATGCVHPMVKYRKSMLLDPMMDPAKTSRLSDVHLSSPSQQFEKASIDSSASSGSSCPTCGG